MVTHYFDEQPEVKAVAKQIVKWHPTMFLDLHGYYNPMIIDPTTNLAAEKNTLRSKSWIRP